MSKDQNPDLDRIGLFKEMDYLHGVPYVPVTVSFNEEAHKRKQFEYQDSKLRAANQDGYFDTEYKRLFDGEGYADPIRTQRLFRLENDKKNRPGIFKPSSNTKWPCGAGAIYGTLEEHNKERVPSFSPCIREFATVKCDKNVLVSPMKKGTGYGYPNVTITKAPPYFLEGEYEQLKEEPVEPPDIHAEKGEKKKVFYLPTRTSEYFDVNPFFTKTPMPILRESVKPNPLKTPFIPNDGFKEDGGGTGGCLNKFPNYTSSPFNDKVLLGRSPKIVMNSSNKLFRPVPGVRPYPISSIINVGVKKSVNSCNYKTTTGVVYTKR